MSAGFFAAVIQMNSGEDKSKNLAAAERLVTEAARQGAALIALPEMFNCWGRFETLARQAEPIPGPTSEAAARWAKTLGITLVAGSIAEQALNAEKAFNASLLFGPDGSLLAKYRKQHCADVNLTGKVVLRESQWILAGDQDVVTQTECGRIAQAICYDLRFPELFRRLVDRDAEILAIPSAFSRPTGAAHWEILLRARAIENQTFVLAPNQCTDGPPSPTFGHACIIDPWGTVLAAAADEPEAIVLAEIKLESLHALRAELPALAHRRKKT